MATKNLAELRIKSGTRSDRTALSGLSVGRMFLETDRGNEVFIGTSGGDVRFDRKVYAMPSLSAATLQLMIDEAASAKMELRFTPGEYDITNTRLNAANNSHISAVKGTVIIKSSGLTGFSSGAIDATNKTNVRLDGLIVVGLDTTSATECGISFNSCTDSAIVNCEVAYFRWAGIRLNGGDRLRIRGNYIHHIGTSQNIGANAPYAITGSFNRSWIVSNCIESIGRTDNRAANGNGAGIYCGGFPVSTSGNIYWANQLYDCGAVGIKLVTEKGLVCAWNRVRTNSQSSLSGPGSCGIILTASGGIMHDWHVHNNTIIFENNTSAGILIAEGCYKGKLHDNIVERDVYDGIGIQVIDAQRTTVQSNQVWSDPASTGTGEAYHLGYTYVTTEKLLFNDNEAHEAYIGVVVRSVQRLRARGNILRARAATSAYKAWEFRFYPGAGDNDDILITDGEYEKFYYMYNFQYSATQVTKNVRLERNEYRTGTYLWFNDRTNAANGTNVVSDGDKYVGSGSIDTGSSASVRGSCAIGWLKLNFEKTAQQGRIYALDNSNTPDVRVGARFTIGAGTAVDGLFGEGLLGQRITIEWTAARTLNYNVAPASANIGKLQLAGAANFAGVAGNMMWLECRLDGATFAWHEVSRKV